MSTKDEVKDNNSFVFNIPITDNCKCTKTREELLKTCACLWNMETFKYILVFKDRKGSYIPINPNNNNKDSNTIYELDMVDNSIKLLPKINNKDLIPDITSTYFLNSNDKINYNINLVSNLDNMQGGIIKYFPFYYFFLDANTIIDSVINYYKETPKVFKNIFRLNRDDNSFIGMSLLFNIFNVALFTYKYFNLLTIFAEYFTLKNLDMSHYYQLYNIVLLFSF